MAGLLQAFIKSFVFQLSKEVSHLFNVDSQYFCNFSASINCTIEQMFFHSSSKASYHWTFSASSNFRSIYSIFSTFGIWFSVLGTPSSQTVGLLDGCKRKLSASSNSAELDTEEESPPYGDAPTKLVPIPVLFLPLSNSSGLLFWILTKRLVFCLLEPV